VQPVATDSVCLLDRVPGAGNDEYLSQCRMALDVACLLEEIGAHTSSGISKKFRDVQNPKLGFGAKAGRELGAADVQPCPGTDRRSGLMIQNGASGVLSQNSHPAGTSSRNWDRDSCSPTPGWAPRSRSDCR
jgi:hypothetical protein